MWISLRFLHLFLFFIFLFLFRIQKHSMKRKILCIEVSLVCDVVEMRQINYIGKC